VGAAQPQLLDILGTARVVAHLAPSAVGDAPSSLDDAVGTTVHGTFAYFGRRAGKPRGLWGMSRTALL
jgi:hypothetical protein